MLLSDIMDFPNEHLGMKKDQFPPMDTEMIKEKSQPKKNGFKTPTTTPGQDGDSQPLEKDQSTSVDTEMVEEKSQMDESQMDESKLDESQVDDSQVDESQVDESP